MEPANPLPATQNDINHMAERLQAQINVLSERVRAKADPAESESHFRSLFKDAHISPEQTSQKLIDHCQDNPAESLLDVAKLCLNGPVGRGGERRALRAVAVFLCDELLRRVPNHPDALCLKGEALLPYIHYGRNSWHTPRSVLQEAYNLFDAAAKNGSRLGLFLKGRWLLSMEPLHKDQSQALLGVTCVKAAAEANCSRALVFLAHRYEYPELDRTVSFAADLPRGKAQRERFILAFYQKAAEMGDPDALNDIGTSYAEGYGGLECDFDKAVEYYERAIDKGSLHAFDNLGTHFETGMAGRYPHKIDYNKALFYYRQGAKKRCPKCAYNLAAANEEGMHGVLNRDSKKAEDYYWLALELAEDANDAQTTGKSIKDLAALYITRIKLSEPESQETKVAWRRLVGMVGEERAVLRTMVKVDKAIVAAGRGRLAGLAKLLGDVNSKLIARQVKELRDNENDEFLRHVLGSAPTAKTPEKGSASKRRRRQG